MPKAKPYPDGDEEERTTIESQWEDEASTTVEQGDVADKIRSLGADANRRNNTNVTHTGALDEPTVDDQHAPALSAITPLRAEQNARLSITQGNDTGQSFEIRPGKTYTIGRAIDNDVVLTDIAVSRKHFDLRHEDGAWVIVDHGSGNGTVVNGNVEDNPFMLANGDVIEIGNTVFRFEQERGPVRPQQTVELPEDEEEMSTVAGKPLRAELVEVEPAPTPVVTRPQRPKTLPPPMPMRAIGASQPPPLGLPPQPASTLPLPQMANRPPINAAMPTMLGDPNGMPLQQPTTLPGQAMPPRAPMYSQYPQATEIPPHSVHAQMLLVQSQNRRNDASTAHVPPMSFDPMMSVPPLPAAQPRYTQPQLTRRAKLVLGGAGLAVLAAIATIGIVKSSSKPKASASAQGSGAADPKKKGPTVEAIKPDAPKKGPTVEAITPKAVAKVEAPKQEPWKSDPPKQEPAKVETPKQEPAKVETPKVEPKKQEPAKVETPKVETPKVEPKKQEPAKVETPKVEPKKQEPAKVVVDPPKKQEPKKEEARVEPKKREPKATTEPAPKKVAAAVDPSAAKAKADTLYKSKKFNDAANVLNAAAKSSPDDERELTTTAEYYSKLGKALNAGTAPATDPIVAFENLRKASNYDKNVGNYYNSEITTKLAQVAPKAAYSYLAKKNYQQARIAVIESERYGNADGVSIVRQKLESVARDLYQSAQSDGFDTSNSKDKLKQITLIVDAKSPWYQKAKKALGG